MPRDKFGKNRKRKKRQVEKTEKPEENFGIIFQQIDKSD